MFGMQFLIPQDLYLPKKILTSYRKFISVKLGCTQNGLKLEKLYP